MASSRSKSEGLTRTENDDPSGNERYRLVRESKCCCNMGGGCKVAAEFLMGVNDVASMFVDNDDNDEIAVSVGDDDIDVSDVFGIAANGFCCCTTDAACSNNDGCKAALTVDAAVTFDINEIFDRAVTAVVAAGVIF